MSKPKSYTVTFDGARTLVDGEDVATSPVAAEKLAHINWSFAAMRQEVINAAARMAEADQAEPDKS